MKKFRRFSLVAILIVSLLIFVLGLAEPIFVYAATTPSLGAATTYGVLANTYTNSGAGTTTINGDVGFLVAPIVPPGGTHTNYGSGGPYATAGANQTAALTDLNNQACTFTWTAAVELSADALHGGTIGTYPPGVYCGQAAMAVSGPITLSGSGTYIFRSVGAFDTSAGAVVTLAGGASVCDVFWTSSGATTLGASTSFQGTLIDDAAVTVGANTVWAGRALAFNGPVTTGASSTISVPTCTSTLHVIKDVINNSGGNSPAASFNLHLKLAGTDVAGSPAPGAASPGTSYTLAAGTYNLSEDPNASYTQSFGGDCDSSGNVTLAAGADKTCTITNDDRPASITVIKVVINDSGRVKNITDFPLFVDLTPVTSGATNIFAAPGVYSVTETTDANYAQTFSGDCNSSGSLNLSPGDTKVCTITNDDIGAPIITPPVPPLIAVVKVPSPLALPSGPGLVTYAYTLHNIGTVPATSITMVDDSCSPVVLVSGDTNSNTELDVNETWAYTCATTLSTTHTNTVIATGLANGITATDTASATVVVGAPIVPPLIHVTKVPNPLTLLVGGGMVTYTEMLTNPGTAALGNVTITDNKCAPLNFVSGDTNNDSKLDSGETWIYTCQTNVTTTTTNTAIASGDANGLTATDFAIATVVVAAAPDPGQGPTILATTLPKLPNTGIGSEVGSSNGWALVIPTGIAIAWIARNINQKSQ